MEKSEFNIITLPPKIQPGSKKFKHNTNFDKERWEGIDIESVGIPRKGLLSSSAPTQYCEEAEKT